MRIIILLRKSVMQGASPALLGVADYFVAQLPERLAYSAVTLAI